MFIIQVEKVEGWSMGKAHSPLGVIGRVSLFKLVMVHEFTLHPI